MGVLFQFYLWDQSHVTIVWNTRETGENIPLSGTKVVLYFPVAEWCECECIVKIFDPLKQYLTGFSSV